MATNHEESNALLQQDEKKSEKHTGSKTDADSPKAPACQPGIGNEHGWITDGLPLGHGSVVGEPMGRTPWSSSICDCLGTGDEFCISDLEVCKSVFKVPFGLRSFMN